MAGGHPHALSLEGQRVGGGGGMVGFVFQPTHPHGRSAFSKWETTNVPTMNKVSEGNLFLLLYPRKLEELLSKPFQIVVEKKNWRKL